MYKPSKTFIAMLSLLLPLLLVASIYLNYLLYYKGKILTPKEWNAEVQKLNKENYCEKKSDCIAVKGVQSSCAFINKKEMDFFQKAYSFFKKTDCSRIKFACQNNKCQDDSIPVFPVDHFTSPVPIPISYIQVSDFSKDDILLGSSHNIFIARILKQEGAKDLGFGPETQFKVEIISNIKGDLHGTVTVDQFGGYKNGVFYGVETENPDKSMNTAEKYILQEGNTYLLATRYNEQEDWYTLNTFYTASKLLSTDKNMKPSDLKTLADKDERVKALKKAYPNEKLLDADISHGNTKNSFASLSKAEQEKIKAEIEKVKVKI